MYHYQKKQKKRVSADGAKALHVIMNANEEYIVFCAKPEWDIDEAYVLMLLHEINHWAQNMFLTADEVFKSKINYYETRRAGKTPFTEWINSSADCYDMSEWEEKYKRKYDSMEQ